MEKHFKEDELLITTVSGPAASMTKNKYYMGKQWIRNDEKVEDANNSLLELKSTDM